MVGTQSHGCIYVIVREVGNAAYIVPRQKRKAEMWIHISDILVVAKPAGKGQVS